MFNSVADPDAAQILHLAKAAGILCFHYDEERDSTNVLLMEEFGGTCT